jgi:predicted dinucleotide-binding enzyme
MEPANRRPVGIIGAGRLGQAMARTAVRADVDAKAEMISLFEDAGFVAIDLGSLSAGGAMQQVGAPLAGVNLIRLSA